MRCHIPHGVAVICNKVRIRVVMLPMVRPHTQIYPPRSPAPLRPAADMLLLRDGAQGLEVLLTRRAESTQLAAAAYVFPGGGVDIEDHKPLITHTEPAQAATALVARRAGQSDAQCAQALAAIRETFEEVGLLLARHPDGSWCSQKDIDGLNRQAPFYAQVQQRGWTLAADSLLLQARWVTDRERSQRFDVPLFVARAPSGQTAVVDGTGQFDPQWLRPADALARYAAGQLHTVFQILHSLQWLQDFVDVDAVLRACASDQALWVSCPRTGRLKGQESRHMEHEPAYGELALVCPDGHTSHSLDWQHQHPVRLLQHVQRLTAPNPGLMTGPGTNTYIVGTAETGYIVIDPGPDDTGHIRRIFETTEGDINAIVCTHSHADHAPAAQPLRALVVENTNTVPGDLMGEFASLMCPIVGLPSGPNARDNTYFDPDITLQNNELLTQYFRGQDDDSTLKITLQVIYTPGHASNHLCLLLQEDGLLFSGDHILSGTTPVIDPPDGDMTAYLASLDTLAAACDHYEADFILPAHGYAMTHCVDSKHSGGAQRVIAALKKHRLKREGKVIAALREHPQASVDALLPMVYADVDATLWPVAKRSLAAHVQRIQTLGLA
jgi:recombination protein RecT